MSDPTHSSVVSLIDGFLKTASADLEKEAKNLDLAGDAKSTHPSANVDDKTKPATEGSRSAENEADVKKDVPNTINDESSKNTGGTEGATVNGDQGTETMAADSGLKGTVDTPKKDHSKSMSDSGPGDDTFNNNWDKASAAAALTGEANDLLASLTLLSKQAGEEEGGDPAPAPAEGDAAPAAAPADGGEAAPETPPAPAPAEGAAEGSDAEDKSASGEEVALFKAAAEEYPEDVEAGYVAAALLAQELGLLKGASAEDETAEAVASIQKEAAADAEAYATFLGGFEEILKKSAMPYGADPAAMAALAGEGEAGGELGAEEMAEGEEEAEEGAEELAEGGEEAAGGDAEAIAALLAQLGISPEELMAAISGGDEGTAPEMAAGGEAAPEVA